MVAKAGSHLLAATALAVLAGAGLSAGSARAQSSACLATPNGPAPAGTHWYYKTDQATHQKCWYTRAQDEAAQAAPAQTAPSRTVPTRTTPAQIVPAQADTANPDSDTAAPEESVAPVAAAPAAASRQVPERAAPLPPAAPRRAAATIVRVPVPTADPRGEQQPLMSATTAVPTSAAVPAAPGSVAWPDPPSLPQTPGIAGPSSPFPPPPSVNSQTDASGPSGTAASPTAGDPPATRDNASANAAPAADATAQSSTPTAERPGGDSPSVKADADTSTAATKPPGRISVLLVLAALIVLVIVGMLLRRLVEHALGRRRVIKLVRQEPRLAEPVAVPPPMPTVLRRAPSVVPVPRQTEQRADEVEDALRQLAHSLRQPQPAANGAANSTTGRNGAGIRS